jgi:hypothetical protein
MKGKRMLSPRTRQSFLPEMTLVYLQLGEMANFLFSVHNDPEKSSLFSQFHFRPLMINCGVLKRAVFHIA